MTKPQGYPVSNADDLPFPDNNPTRWTHVLGVVFVVTLWVVLMIFLGWWVTTSLSGAMEAIQREFDIFKVPSIAVCGFSDVVCHLDLGGRPLDSQPVN